ncbi:MAG: MFS transporter [Bdellovibrionota bacterium]|nr:hypothetical protein [Pseudobdellovibrionaceae bacterium]|tara:strand:+ start:34687 stop:35892 length:1206 start_codon:yes stop_codon:yes gene_type:complete
MRVIAFLFSQFVSGVGDALLLFAFPAGLGMEFNDIRPAVLLWLIPGIAMFLSSFLAKIISKRVAVARKDYGKLMIGIAIVELITASLTFYFDSKLATIILSGVFVFFYAFAKEGLPRLFYFVSIYRYFEEESSYNKLLGYSTSINILAGLAGTIFASYLVFKSSWRTGLLIDAITFLLIGFVILFFGRDVVPSTKVEKKVNIEPQEHNIEKTLSSDSRLRIIFYTAPILFCTNALAWNYISLIAKDLKVFEVSMGILLIAILRLPGILAGSYFYKLFESIPQKFLLIAPPVLAILSNILFLIFPSKLLFSTSILFQGFVYGVYWPTDTGVRNEITNQNKLIFFNSRVLKRLSLYQLASCVLALYIYSHTDYMEYLIPFSILIPIVFLGLSFIEEKKWKFTR